ncbi:MAG: succinate dehydrogenase, cytochrome b556 subunit [Natronospirillum sp.]
MKADRPINLDLATISFPLPAINSILHRITGIALFIGSAFMVWFLYLSLSSPAGFAQATSAASHGLAKFIIWGTLSVLIFHLTAGIRHLLMDMGIGETLEAGRRSSWAVVAVSVVLIILAGVWVW